MATALFLFISNHPSSFYHPFYVSVTEINHNPKEKILEISCKIFTDDLEKTLSNYTNTKIDLSDPKMKTISDKAIAVYIAKHLQLKIDGKPSTLQFIGSEKEEEATWSYFQINDIPSVKKIDVINDLLYDMYDEETNIMHVMANGKKQSIKLSKPETQAGLEF